MEKSVASLQQRTWTRAISCPQSGYGNEKQSELDYSKMRIPGYHPFEEFAEALEAAVERKL